MNGRGARDVALGRTLEPYLWVFHGENGLEFPVRETK